MRTTMGDAEKCLKFRLRLESGNFSKLFKSLKVTKNYFVKKYLKNQAQNFLMRGKSELSLIHREIANNNFLNCERTRKKKLSKFSCHLSTRLESLEFITKET